MLAMAQIWGNIRPFDYYSPKLFFNSVRPSLSHQGGWSKYSQMADHYASGWHPRRMKAKVIEMFKAMFLFIAGAAEYSPEFAAQMVAEGIPQQLESLRDRWLAATEDSVSEPESDSERLKKPKNRKKEWRERRRYRRKKKK